MSRSRKINTKTLVDKIGRMTKERIAKDTIVSLDEYRQLRQRASSRTLLVVEDDETMRNALRRIFEGEGYRVVSASDGTQLSSVLDDSPIDLIILDIGLPWLNGFELAQLLKEHESLHELPLIFVSAKTSDFDVKKGFEVGANDYIKKPFDIDHIKKTVRTLLALNE